MIKKSVNFTYLLIFSILSIYCMHVSLKSPAIGIELQEEGESWKVIKISYEDWGKREGIQIGDTILSVDDIPIEDTSVIKIDQMIRTAHKIEFIDQSTYEKKTIENISIFNIEDQIFTHLIFPLIYFLLSLSVSIKLMMIKDNSRNLKLLNLIVISVSLAYISSGASTIHNPIGLMVNGCSLVSSTILLLHFSKAYLSKFNKAWPSDRIIKIFYSFIPIQIFIDVLGYFKPTFISVSANIILLFFLVPFFFTLYYLISGYIKYRDYRIKTILLSIVVPFLPFIFLFVLPQIFFQTYIIAAEYTVLFFLFIPFLILFTQMIDRLFELEYFISRLFTYVNYSMIFTAWISVFSLFFLKVNVSTLPKFGLLNFLSLIVLFYLKELIDFSTRKTLLSKKGDYVHKLYNLIEVINKEIKFKSIIESLKNVILMEFQIKYVHVGQYVEKSGEFIINDETNIRKEIFNTISFDKFKIGQIRRIKDLYICCIFINSNSSYFLILSHDKKFRLSNEELLLLELLSVYIENLLHSSVTIEELVAELNKKDIPLHSKKTVLNKLLFARFEKEKQLLAQDLHDNVIQDLVYSSRNLQLLKTSDDHVKIEQTRQDFSKIINNLRTYCEELKPPLLETMGLDAALHNLVLKYQKTSQFKIIHQLDRIYLHDEEEELVIYRIFQELLSNAFKHSKAHFVDLKLKNIENGILIEYWDDGIGFDYNKAIESSSMGLTGILEKVNILGGAVNIQTEPNNGVYIQIKIDEESSVVTV